jgi:hypothetical protein
MKTKKRNLIFSLASIVVVITLLTACSQVQTTEMVEISPSTPSSTETPSLSPTETPTEMPSETLTKIPTSTLTPTSTPMTEQIFGKYLVYPYQGYSEENGYFLDIRGETFLKANPDERFSPYTFIPLNVHINSITAVNEEIIVDFDITLKGEIIGLTVKSMYDHFENGVYYGLTFDSSFLTIWRRSGLREYIHFSELQNFSWSNELITYLILYNSNKEYFINRENFSEDEFQEFIERALNGDKGFELHIYWLAE